MLGTWNLKCQGKVLWTMSTEQNRKGGACRAGSGSVELLQCVFCRANYLHFFHLLLKGKTNSGDFISFSFFHCFLQHLPTHILQSPVTQACILFFPSDVVLSFCWYPFPLGWLLQHWQRQLWKIEALCRQALWCPGHPSGQGECWEWFFLLSSSLMKCERASGNLLSEMAKFNLAAAWVTAGLGQMPCCFIPTDISAEYAEYLQILGAAFLNAVLFLVFLLILK